MPRLPRALTALLFTVPIACGQTLAADTPAGKAAAPAPITPRQPLGERSDADASALARELPQGEQQSLEAGSEKFLALWKPANTPAPEGVVILIPGLGENADWPQVIGPLRGKLPDVGWGSLSLTLPDPQDDANLRRPALPPAVAKPASDAKAADPKAPPATPADPPTPPSANEPATAEIQAKVDAERIFARIDAGIAFAKQQNAKSLVLLGHGSGAYWAARYINERQTADVNKLLLVAGESPFDAKPPLEELTPTLKLVVGDFYYKGRPDTEKRALERLQASKRLKNTNFSQVGLDALPGNSALEQEQLFRRLRGVLKPAQ